ncbi:methoxy mycolic acid synthase [Camillea tinctor]|nr:methoxy mycolic acid synthase [Camillea tinctor]
MANRLFTSVDSKSKIGYLSNAVTGNLTNYITKCARSFVIEALKRIRHEELIIEDTRSDETLCFSKPGKLSCQLKVVNDSMWWRVLSGGSIGLAESYMLGEVECPDMTAFLEVMILNRDNISDMSNPLSSLASALVGWTRASNRISTSPNNVKAHYDISNEVFESFLSPDTTYSCPIWLPQDSIESKTDTLAVPRSGNYIKSLTKPKIKQSDHVLDIGTGWGSFAIEAVKMTRCRVTSLTLSVEQKAEAEARITKAGFESRISVVLKDYREFSADHDQPFDKIVSIEMLEHVGKDYLPEYFRIVDKLLRRKGGIAIFQSSTMPETGSGGDLVLDRFVNLGGHYSRYLREWRENFLANFETSIVPALKEKNAGLTEGAIESFIKRKWLFYFPFCEAVFNTKTIGVAIVTFAREGAVETLEGIQP